MVASASEKSGGESAKEKNSRPAAFTIATAAATAFLVDAELAARVEHQRAVELVGPAVIGADQAVGVARLGLADARAAVAADIVKGADLAVRSRTTMIDSVPTL
jgi:hypothetical protein